MYEWSYFENRMNVETIKIDDQIQVDQQELDILVCASITLNLSLYFSDENFKKLVFG
jgi:hypothetical protein